MGNDLTRAGGGALVPSSTALDHGHVTVPAGGNTRGGDVAHGADIAVSDAEHLSNFGSDLAEAFAAKGIRDQTLVGKIVGEASALNEAAGRHSGDLDLVEVADAFGQRLIRVGVTEPRALCTAMAIAFTSLLEANASNVAERDASDKKIKREKLKALWGANVVPTVRAIEAFVNNPMKFPLSLADAVFNGRDADGRLIRNSPDVIRWLGELAGVTTAGGGLSPESIETEMAKIQHVMKTDSRRYYGDAKMQARLLELIRAQQQAQGGR